MEIGTIIMDLKGWLGMEWIDRLNNVINYIEEHLVDEIRNDEIEKIVACSVGTFQRAFSLLTGITITEYIRRRKMTMAAFELQSSDSKVIDIAMKYGYESADAFSVAFKRMHGIAPINARQQNIMIKSYPCLSFTLIIKGDIEMNYRIVEKEAFKAVGKIVTSSLDNNIIPQFWDECKKDGTLDRLFEVGVNKCTLGVCFGYNNEGFNNYMVGIETNQEHTEGMETVIIPKSTWLVFESVGPISPTLENVWKRIYGEFLPQSIYKQAETPTMEVYYRNDTWAEDYYCEVWMPVEKN